MVSIDTPSVSKHSPNFARPRTRTLSRYSSSSPDNFRLVARTYSSLSVGPLFSKKFRNRWTNSADRDDKDCCFPSRVANSFCASRVIVLAPAKADPYLLWISIQLSPSISSSGSAFIKTAASIPPSPEPSQRIISAVASSNSCQSLSIFWANRFPSCVVVGSPALISSSHCCSNPSNEIIEAPLRLVVVTQ